MEKIKTSKTDTRPKSRKGIKLYIDYFENEFEDLTAEEIGMLIYSLYEYDQFNECRRYQEEIANDKLLKMIYKRLCANNDRAVMIWNSKKNWREQKEAEKKAEAEKTAKELNSEYMTDTFEIELEDGSAIIFNATYNEETNYNIPSKYELTEFLKELGGTSDEQAEILQRIERQGMLDHWKRHWREYIEERSIFDD